MPEWESWSARVAEALVEPIASMGARSVEVLARGPYLDFGLRDALEGLGLQVLIPHRLLSGPEQSSPLKSEGRPDAPPAEPPAEPSVSPEEAEPAPEPMPFIALGEKLGVFEPRTRGDIEESPAPAPDEPLEEEDLGEAEPVPAAQPFIALGEKLGVFEPRIGSEVEELPEIFLESEVPESEAAPDEPLVEEYLAEAELLLDEVLEEQVAITPEEAAPEQVVHESLETLVPEPEPAPLPAAEVEPPPAREPERPWSFTIETPAASGAGEAREDPGWCAVGGRSAFVSLWHPNGRLREAGEVRGGKRHGHWTSWDENGEVIEVAEYVEGKPLTHPVGHEP